MEQVVGASITLTTVGGNMEEFHRRVLRQSLREMLALQGANDMPVVSAQQGALDLLEEAAIARP